MSDKFPPRVWIWPKILKVARFVSATTFQQLDDDQEYLSLEEAKAIWEPLVEWLEYIANSCPGPNQTYETENKFAAQKALAEHKARLEQR